MEGEAAEHPDARAYVLECVRRGQVASGAEFLDRIGVPPAPGPPPEAPEPPAAEGEAAPAPVADAEGESAAAPVGESAAAPEVEAIAGDGAPAEVQAEEEPEPEPEPDWRPVISGRFIADLWLGLIEGADIHPTGIKLAGWRIPEGINVDGTRRSRDGREGPQNLDLTTCDLAGGIHLSSSRIGDIALYDCSGSLHLDSAEVSGTVQINRSRLTHVNLTDARIEGDLRIYFSSISESCHLGGMRIARDLFISNSRFDGRAWSGRNPRVEGLVLIEASRFAPAVFLEGLEAGSLRMINNRFLARRPSLSIASARIEREIVVEDCRFAGHFDATFSTVGGRVRMGHVRAIGVISFNSAVLNQDLVIADGLAGGVDVAEARIDHGIWLFGTALLRMGLDGTKCHASELHLANVSVTAIQCNGATLSGDVRLDRVAVNYPRSIRWPDKVDTDQVVVAFENAKIEGGLSGAWTLFAGQVLLRDSTIGGQLWFDRVIGRTLSRWSFQFEGAIVRSLVVLSNVQLSCGVKFPSVRCAELKIEGSNLGTRMRGTRPIAFWGSDCSIERRISLEATEVDGRRYENEAQGMVDLSNTTVGETLLISSLRAALPDAGENAHRLVVLDLAGCKVKSNVRIDSSFADTLPPGSPHGPVLSGCLRVDRAQIDGDFRIHGGTMRALGAPETARSDSEREERVTRRKEGVALSMRGAVVRGELQIGRPSFTGIVDLRDADVRLVSDGCGRRWRRAGIGAGQLLLDGFTYRDMDEVLDVDDAVPTLRRRVSRWMRERRDLADHRLDWLHLQFAGRRHGRKAFAPQPYEQLALVFGVEGNERARRKVVVRKRDLQLRLGRMHAFERALGHLLKWTSNYGYSPVRAAVWLGLFVAAGALAADWLKAHEILQIAGDFRGQAIAFNPLVYAIDVAVPVVNLNQDSVFLIASGRFPGQPYAEAMLMIGKAIYQIVGLALASITILTLTGTLREKD